MAKRIVATFRLDELNNLPVVKANAGTPNVQGAPDMIDELRGLEGLDSYCPDVQDTLMDRAAKERTKQYGGKR